MNKIIASTLAVVVFNIFSPVAPLAHAGTLENQLTQVIGQNVSADRIQQLLTVKTQLEQRNGQGLVEALTNAALNQSGQAEVASATTKPQEKLSQAAQNALRQQVEKQITDRIAPYEKELSVIRTLFGNQSLAPNEVDDNNNSVTSAPENYKRVN